MTPLEIALRAQDLLAFYLVQPALILMLGIFTGKVLEQLIIFFGKEFAPKRTRVKVLAVVVGWVAYITAFMLALRSIGVLRISLLVASVIVLVVVSLHLAMSLIDFLSNYRYFRDVQKKVLAKSVISTSFGKGTVVGVQLAQTHLKLKNGDDLYIPNKTMRTLKIEIEKKA